MVTSSDDSYKSTKLIKQGKAKMCADFEPLADWIFTIYGHKPINIIYGKLYDENNFPRLEIIFENEVDFYYKEVFYIYDSEITKAISQKLEELLLKAGLNKKRKFFNSFFDRRNKYPLKGLYVTFSHFKPLAQSEANLKINSDEVDQLNTELINTDIWKNVRNFSSTTFFFYEQAQIQKNIDNGFKDIATAKYFRLIKKYDEFNYIHEDEFAIDLDSKENLDKNYGGSLINYFQ